MSHIVEELIRISNVMPFGIGSNDDLVPRIIILATRVTSTSLV